MTTALHVLLYALAAFGALAVVGVFIGPHERPRRSKKEPSSPSLPMAPTEAAPRRVVQITNLRYINRPELDPDTKELPHSAA